MTDNINLTIPAGTEKVTLSVEKSAGPTVREILPLITHNVRIRVIESCGEYAWETAPASGGHLKNILGQGDWGRFLLELVPTSIELETGSPTLVNGTLVNAGGASIIIYVRDKENA